MATSKSPHRTQVDAASVHSVLIGHYDHTMIRDALKKWTQSCTSHLRETGIQLRYILTKVLEEKTSTVALGALYCPLSKARSSGEAFSLSSTETTEL